MMTASRWPYDIVSSRNSEEGEAFPSSFIFPALKSFEKAVTPSSPCSAKWVSTAFRASSESSERFGYIGAGRYRSEIGKPRLESGIHNADRFTYVSIDHVDVSALDAEGSELAAKRICG